MMTSMTLIRMSISTKSQLTHLSKMTRKKTSFEQPTASSDFKFPIHVCWAFNNMLRAIPLFKIFERIGTNHLPRVYISNNDYLPKPKGSGGITVNLQRIIRSYGRSSGIALELD